MYGPMRLLIAFAALFVVGLVAAAFIGRRRAAGRADRIAERLQPRRGWLPRIHAFFGLFYWVLVGPAPDGQRRAQPCFRRFHGDGNHRHGGSSSDYRSDGVGIFACHVRCLHCRMVHNRRNLACFLLYTSDAAHELTM